MITRTTSESVVTRGYISATANAALLGILLPVQLALGQDSGTVTVDVEHCFELESAAARRTCFGAQVDEVLEERGSTESDQPSQTIEAGSAADAPTVVESRESETDDGDGDGDGEYFGTIVAMRERLPSSYVITLDNGQIWQQTEPKKYPLRPGLEVRIYPTRWGGRHRLSGVGSGGHIQVQRLR